MLIILKKCSETGKNNLWGYLEQTYLHGDQCDVMLLLKR